MTRWNKQSPSCSRCRSYFPTTSGWRCFVMCEMNKHSQPEEILDTEAGNCGRFMYRSTQLEEEPICDANA